jgi:hypothetical protein
MGTSNVNEKYKNASGSRLLRGLFFEETGADKTGVAYTLKERDHEGYASLKRLYMEIGDLTEYRFATQCLDGLEHWDMLCNCNWFKPYVEKWRRELSLKIQSTALANILEETLRDSPAKFSANKYVLEQGWAPKTRNKAGRPSKEAIREAAEDHLSMNRRLEADMDRLELRIAN